MKIDNANSLNGETYAEPIQRLSDLEWLTYKEKNNSIVDELFTGQLVEAHRCTACNHISVSIQNFSVLPVPIVEARQLNGLVYLEDCFTKFGTTEDLYGPDGLRCECCNRMNRMVPSSGQFCTPKSHLNKAHLQPELGASPILSNGGMDNQAYGNCRNKFMCPNSDGMSPLPNCPGETAEECDSGFHDNQMRTSTPILNPMCNTGVKLTDGQKRSLLRQLPDCLVVQILRFSQSFGELTKLRKPVSVPLNGLDLTHLIIDNVMDKEDLTGLRTNFKYDLYGVCVHLGGDCMSAGHYISFVKVQDGKWYKFDDEFVTAVNMEYELTTKLLRENAYLLFYRKCGTPYSSY